MISKRLFAAASLSLLALTGAAQAADPEACKEVRFSDVGWSCVTATTSIAVSILEGLGYDTKVDVLSVPVTFRAWPTRTSTPSWASGCRPSRA